MYDERKGRVMQSDRRARLIGFALIILAVCVQLQATLEFGGTPIRANAADLFLMILSPIILIFLYQNFARLREIAGPHLLVFLGIATTLISFSLFRGYEAMSGLSSWAAVKYVGWYILLFYLATGALISVLSGSVGREKFTLVFVFFQVVLIIAFQVIVYAELNWLFNEGGRLTGFAGNTNAMAFYFICGFALALSYIGRSDLPPRLGGAMFVAAAIIFAGILFTKSIASLIALISVVLFAGHIGVTTLKRLLQVLALGISLWMAPQIITASHALVTNVLWKLFGIILSGAGKNPDMDELYFANVLVRMDGYWAAFALWKADPVFGAGLGVHLHLGSLEEKPAHLVFQIHNTALWLLAEMGLAGLSVMVCIFLVLFYKVWVLARSPSREGDSTVWFHSAVLLTLVGWAVMSLFHEFMYQRLVWLLAGMALTAPVQPLSLWKGGGLK
jgi:O-antigen ligase